MICYKAFKILLDDYLSQKTQKSVSFSAIFKKMGGFYVRLVVNIRQNGWVLPIKKAQKYGLEPCFFEQ